jgi:hypothetical protein
MVADGLGVRTRSLRRRTLLHWLSTGLSGIADTERPWHRLAAPIESRAATQNGSDAIPRAAQGAEFPARWQVDRGRTVLILLPFLLRRIAFGIFLTSDVQKKPRPVRIRLLTVSICSYIALKKAAFRIEKLADAA